MAVPRVFISSTYYDLKHVRNDLENFIQSLGYEPVLHDKGKVTYTQDESIENSCYSELSTCDIVIGIIGNKFGSESFEGNYSITMQELKSALKENKKIYIFIDSNVYIENNTYFVNRDKEGLNYPAVDDIRIHEFVTELKSVVKNHPILKFDNVSEIITFLKLQFAGLFQQLLRREATITEQTTYNDLKELLVEFKKNNICLETSVSDLNIENDNFLERLSGTRYIVNHFSTELIRLVGLKNLKIVFIDRMEVEEFLTFSGYIQIEIFDPDSDDFSKEMKEEFNDYSIFEKNSSNKIMKIKVCKKLFNSNDKLLWFSKGEWKEEYLIYEEVETTQNDMIIAGDDDLPF